MMDERHLPAPTAGAGLRVSRDRVAPLIAAWLAEVGQRSGSRRTPETYRRELERFRSAVETIPTSAPFPAGVNTSACHAFAYAPGPSGRSPAPATITVRLAALRSFFDFARRMGVVDVNPVDEVKRPKSRDPVPHGLDVDALRRLLAAIPDTKAGRRDRAVIVTMLLTGMRRAEVFSLRAGDLEGSGDHLTYTVRVKGGRTRRRQLPTTVAAAIADAWQLHDPTTLSQLDPATRLFQATPQAFTPTSPGTPLERASVTWRRTTCATPPPSCGVTPASRSSRSPRSSVTATSPPRRVTSSAWRARPIRAGARWPTWSACSALEPRMQRTAPASTGAVLCSAVT